ncbi:hypothetical protein A3223_08065 [Campylobacter concisus]|nr:hypothetical protein A3223_08065 [Campylobacter concisus]
MHYSHKKLINKNLLNLAIKYRLNLSKSKLTFFWLAFKLIEKKNLKQNNPYIWLNRFKKIIKSKNKINFMCKKVTSIL